jgi:hypothetical protein
MNTKLLSLLLILFTFNAYSMSNEMICKRLTDTASAELDNELQLVDARLLVDSFREAKQIQEALNGADIGELNHNSTLRMSEGLRQKVEQLNEFNPILLKSSGASVVFLTVSIYGLKRYVRLANPALKGASIFSKGFLKEAFNADGDKYKWRKGFTLASTLVGVTGILAGAGVTIWNMNNAKKMQSLAADLEELSEAMSDESYLESHQESFTLSRDMAKKKFLDNKASASQVQACYDQVLESLSNQFNGLDKSNIAKENLERKKAAYTEYDQFLKGYFSQDL